jgi:Zn-finger nucleic acid-binding protein
MDCPICRNVTLAVSERQGIEIDYCPQCRGVWLDRGELDKIIERASPATEMDTPPPRYRDRASMSEEYRDSRYGGYPRKRKREGFLSDLFDFD